MCHVYLKLYSILCYMNCIECSFAVSKKCLCTGLSNPNYYGVQCGAIDRKNDPSFEMK